ncbi:PHP domain-containing protein [Chloroflexota bacterium]
MKNKMVIDLHIHSKYSSDGILDPKEIVSIARKKGLNGIAITDHDTVQGGQHAKEYETEDFIIIVGAEIMTDKGEVTGLFLSREITSRHLEDVIAEIREQDGIIIVPHPFDGLRSSAFHITDEYAHLVDAIEGFNARCVLQRYNRRAVEFAARHNLPVVGGSDAHYANEIGLGGIIIDGPDIRMAILNSQLSLFGRRTSLLNHARTKVRKLCGKAAE